MQPYRVFRALVWEVLLNIIAVGLVIAIFALLYQYRNLPVPDGIGPIGFNALLALLSTILRATLVIIVSQVISQRKWDWYSEGERPLSDLQQFDAGSRGALGALSLLPTIRWRDPVTLMAIFVVLTSFLVGPFVQQVSRTQDCSFPLQDSEAASLPFAHYVPRRGGYEETKSGHAIATQDLVSSIFSAVTATDSVENRVIGTCATGHCTFPARSRRNMPTTNAADEEPAPHTTVGICSTCIDISSLTYFRDWEFGVEHIPESYSIRLSHHQTSVINGTGDLSWLGDLLTPDLRERSRWAYVNATFLARDSYRNRTAAVCILYPCVRTYVSDIVKNSLLQTEVQSDIMQVHVSREIEDPGSALNSLDNRAYDYVAVQSPCREQDDDVASVSATHLALYNFTDYGGPHPYRHTHHNVTVSEHCIYRQRAQFVMAISKVFKSDIFQGGCQSHQTPFCRGGGDGIAAAALGTVLDAISYSHGDGSFGRVTRWFDSFADAMTNRFRIQFGAAAFNSSNPAMPDTIRYNVNSTSSAPPPGEVQGVAWRPMVCVHVHWWWLLLPACLTVITTALSVWTVAVCWRHRHNRPVWKDSVLPLIFYHHLFETKAVGLPTRPPGDGGADDDNGDVEPEDEVTAGTDHADRDRLAADVLLEAGELKTMGDQIWITFQWPGGDETSSRDDLGMDQAISLHQLRHRTRHGDSIHSLL